MTLSKLSLKWLDVFQQAARSGSVQQAAQATGLSVSTVSHHLRQLEQALGVALLDHGRRPMRLTPTGARFLDHVEEALTLLRRAELEARSGDMAQTQALSLALIEDFDSGIAPELARLLATAMPGCTFRHLTRPSHEILQMLRDRTVDIGVAARPPFDLEDLIEYPILRDPFVLAVPAAAPEANYLGGASGLPLLRYSRDQILGRQIEAHLQRLRISLPNMYEFESNETILSMVAEGAGWAISTPTNYIRAARSQRQLAILPFPDKGYARVLSVFTTELHPSAAAEGVARTLRQLAQARAIDPAVARLPWLQGEFALAV